MSELTEALTLEEIHALATKVLLKNGADELNAKSVADTVTSAERDGSVSHGLFRIPGYVTALKSGKVRGDADPKVEEITPVILRCDAEHGFAPTAHARALPPLADAAKKFGVAALSIQRTHHFAALWPEVEKLGEQGLVALTCVSYLPWVAPAGGKSPLFGTNPIAFAWPRKNHEPVVIDMATSAMAMGEVQIAAREGHEVPLGTGLNKAGELTTSAAEIAEGVLLTFGGYKGSAIALMVELMAGPLVGETFSYETQEQDNGDGGPAPGGQFILALSPDILSDKDWAEQSERFYKKYEALEGTRLPGSRRYMNRMDKGPREVNAALLETIRNL